MGFCVVDSVVKTGWWQEEHVHEYSSVAVVLQPDISYCVLMTSDQMSSVAV